MYSQCPDCLTRFRVTAEVLRAAQGTVRCGRCGSAFNALANLSDTLPPPGASPTASALVSGAPLSGKDSGRTQSDELPFSLVDLDEVFVDEREWRRKYGPTGGAGEATDALIPTNEPSELLVDETEPLEDITLEGERIQIELPPGFLEDGQEPIVDVLGQDASFDLESTDRFKALDEREIGRPRDDRTQRETWPSIAESTPTGAPQGTVGFRITETMRAQMAAVASRVPPSAAAPPGPAPPRTTAAATGPTTAPEPVAVRALEPVATEAGNARPVGSIAPRRWQPQAAGELSSARAQSEDESEEPEASGHRLAWTLGCLVLALALLAQLTHYFRHELVRHPQLGPMLSSVYSGLGLELEPNWDPGAFEVRQWGGGGGARDGRLSVQASIRNKAAFAQPYPLLRVELEDRFGDVVATRDFEPAEYLKVPAQARRLLAPGASADAGLDIVAKGADAVGYRLNVCLRESAQTLRCAQGPG